MTAQPLLHMLDASSEFQSLLEGLRRGFRDQQVYGLSGSAKSYVAAALRQATGRPLLYVTATAQGAERVREDLRTWLDGHPVQVFPALELLPFEVVAHSPEVMAQRLGVLERLARGEEPIVVAPVSALLRALPPAELFVNACLTLQLGDRLDLEGVLRRLVQLGYQRVDPVEGPGQFSVRGGILDVFPLTVEQPWRIELFDDEVDSIRAFDVASQRSEDQVKQVLIPPAREFILQEDRLAEALRRIRRDLETSLHRLEKKPARADREGSDGAPLPAALESALRRGRERPPAEQLKEKVGEVLERLNEGAYFEGLEQYLPYFYSETATLLDYFPSDLLVVVDDPARVKEAADEADMQVRERQTRWLETGGLLSGQTRLALSYSDWAYHLSSRKAIGFSLLLKAMAGSQPQNIVSVAPKPMQLFHGQWPMFQDEVNRWRTQKYASVCFVATEERGVRLRDALADVDVTAALSPDLGNLRPGQVAIVVGALETGFQWPALRLVTVTDGEIFGRPKARRRPQSAPTRAAGDAANRQAVKVSSVRDLKVGDFVVHVNHGIGKYLGIQTESILGVTRDYLVIRYEGADRLKIPTDQIHLVQKYVGAEGHEPKLNKLGGGEWNKVKSRVKESIQKMAIELLRLQALRESQPGFGFSPDSLWQREFEDAFKYEETPDQLRAADEIKRDMEKSRTMDRLLCGDVGYGKTEVALRAIFKAVQDGKQVAVLVPTTILAQQHYNTFAERFSGYPVVVDLLSRFRSPKQQEETLRRLAAGEVDVVIGTHRLLSDDLRFKDLGLLIVDEEQRFGVAHKEKIKLLRHNVDVLTLSATPIPRTMHMAMVGMRDISVIETPPEDRFPVETYVAEYNDELVRDAVSRELARGGQVYLLHNKVQTIQRAAARVQALLPEARVIYAHGQMKEDQLERVMIEFLDGEADVLVCTTIIESGLDIANVNTLLVEDADHLGLSQLYQLRGRVGRSNRLAYAYFLYRKDKVLSEVAEKRLQAIREFTEFGAGFKIALRDLEIRGAGNILGPEQHGFIISVGFDLYTQLLDESVRELKGEQAEPVPEPSLELAVDAYIPDAYITDPRQKIEAYQRIMAVRAPADVFDVAEELEDRYGSAPRPVLNLLAIARLKAMCREAGILSMSQAKDRITLRFAERPFLAPDRVMAINRQFRGRLALVPGRTSALPLRLLTTQSDQLLEALEQLVSQFSGLVLASSAVVQ